MTRPMAVGDNVEWYGFGSSLTKGRVESVEHDAGRMTVRVDPKYAHTARKIKGRWCAYSGDKTYKFRIRRT